MTEVVAIPTYLACAELAAKIAEYSFKDQPSKQPIAKTNLSFVGICLAALFVIPAVCSLVVKPFTDLIYKNQKNDTPNKLDITSPSEMQPVKEIDINRTFYKNMYKNHTMEVFMNKGGLKI